MDRAAHLRETIDPAACHAVIVHRGSVAVTDSGLALVPPGAHPDASSVVFLGTAHDQHLVTIVPDEPDSALPSHARWAPLRDVLMQASALEKGSLEAELATTAVAITTWHDTHGHCPRCGSPTQPRQAGWTRQCASCERELYPRTDPAMIVAITDDQDRLLLAHGARFSRRRYSVLAGFVEPGESLEHAVHREVREEVGIGVTDVTYLGSQPWPFPGSVMTAFKARAIETELHLDKEEILDARWVSRDELPELIEAGELVPPPVGSIASRMVAMWLRGDGGPMPGWGNDVSGT